MVFRHFKNVGGKNRQMCVFAAGLHRMVQEDVTPPGLHSDGAWIWANFIENFKSKDWGACSRSYAGIKKKVWCIGRNDLWPQTHGRLGKTQVPEGGGRRDWTFPQEAPYSAKGGEGPGFRGVGRIWPKGKMVVLKWGMDEEGMTTNLLMYIYEVPPSTTCCYPGGHHRGKYSRKNFHGFNPANPGLKSPPITNNGWKVKEESTSVAPWEWELLFEWFDKGCAWDRHHFGNSGAIAK